MASHPNGFHSFTPEVPLRQERVGVPSTLGTPSYLSGTLLLKAEAIVGRRAAFASYIPLPSKDALLSWLSVHGWEECHHRRKYPGLFAEASRASLL
jgi:hypothetical protein